MSEQRRWVIGLAAGTGVVSLTAASGLAFIAHYLVDEFSRPHVVIPDSSFNWGMPKSVGEPPQALQRSLLFHAADGTLLRGIFWAQSHPAPTIILCHGYRVASTHLRPAAELEYSYGYNVLFFDFRGHGDSDSVLTSAGNAEVRDLEAALFVARQQPETLPGKIILHGFSMGASVALLLPPQEDVVAIIADSPYSRSDDIMCRLVVAQLAEQFKHWPSYLQFLRHSFPLLARWIVEVCKVNFRLRFGYSVVARPDLSFKRWKIRSKQALCQQSIPILLIHSAGDTLIPIDHARKLVAEAQSCGVALETYFVENVNHCGAYGVDPEAYNALLQRFLAPHLKDALPQQHRQTNAS